MEEPFTAQLVAMEATVQPTAIEVTMERITIDVSKEELDFIREALADKYRNLISYLDVCEKVSPQESDSVLSQAYESLNKEIKEWTVTTTDESNMVSAVKKRGRPRKNPDAPYGFKKDGTPKKRPGRPAK